jgi:hypothetical protein
LGKEQKFERQTISTLDFMRVSGFSFIIPYGHTYASMMIADGTPLVVFSKRLGHAQVSTTSNIYSHIIKSADEKAAQVTEKFADVITAPPTDIVQLRKA